MENKNNDQEIDLLELLARFYSTLRRNWVLTVICPLLGVGFGILLSASAKHSMYAEMMIVTDLITEGEGKFLTEQLSSAESIPGITDDQKRFIRNFKCELVKGEPQILIEKATTVTGKTPVYIQIKAEISEKQVLPAAQKALINYFNSSKPVIREREERERFYTGMIQKIDLELAAIEAVKKGIDSKTQATYLNPSELFSETVVLYDKKLSYQRVLKNMESVQLVKGFGSLSKSTKLPVTFYVLIGFICGVLVLFVILFMRYFNNYYKNFEKTRRH